MNDARIIHEDQLFGGAPECVSFLQNCRDKIADLPFVTDECSVSGKNDADYGETTVGRLYLPSQAEVSSGRSVKNEMEFLQTVINLHALWRYGASEQ